MYVCTQTYTYILELERINIGSVFFFSLRFVKHTNILISHVIFLQHAQDIREVPEVQLCSTRDKYIHKRSFGNICVLLIRFLEISYYICLLIIT